MVILIIIIIVLLFALYSGGDYFIENGDCVSADEYLNEEQMEDYKSRGLLFDDYDECKKITNLLDNFYDTNYKKFSGLFKLSNLLPVPASFLTSYVYNADSNIFNLEFVEFYKNPIQHTETYRDMMSHHRTYLFYERLIKDNNLIHVCLLDKVLHMKLSSSSASIENYEVDLSETGILVKPFLTKDQLIEILKKNDDDMITMLMQYTGETNHMNILIIDKKQKKIIRIEPNIVSDAIPVCRYADKLLKSLSEPLGYQYFNISNIIGDILWHAKGQNYLKLPICATYSVILSIICIKNNFNKEIISDLIHDVNNSYMTMISLYYIYKFIPPYYEYRLRNIIDPKKNHIGNYYDILFMLSSNNQIKKINEYKKICNEMDVLRNELKNILKHKYNEFGSMGNMNIIEEYESYLVISKTSGLIDIDSSVGRIVLKKNKTKFINYIMYNGDELDKKDYKKEFMHVLRDDYTPRDYYKSIFEFNEKYKDHLKKYNELYNELIPEFRKYSKSLIDTSNEHKVYNVSEECYENIKKYISVLNNHNSKYNPFTISKENTEEANATYITHVVTNIKKYNNTKINDLFNELMTYFESNELKSVYYIFVLLLLIKSGNKTEDIFKILDPGGNEQKYSQLKEKFVTLTDMEYNDVYKNTFTNVPDNIYNELNKIAWEIASSCGHKTFYIIKDVNEKVCVII